MFIKVIKLVLILIFLKVRYNRMNKIKIDGKEYSYFLERNHVYLFTKILAKLDLDIDPKNIKSFNDIIMFVKMIQNALFNFETTDKESLNFIAAIYKIEPEHLREKGLMFEVKLWENLFKDEELVSFFSRVVKSYIDKKKKQMASQKKKT